MGKKVNEILGFISDVSISPSEAINRTVEELNQELKDLPVAINKATGELENYRFIQEVLEKDLVESQDPQEQLRIKKKINASKQLMHKAIKEKVKLQERARTLKPLIEKARKEEGIQKVVELGNQSVASKAKNIVSASAGAAKFINTPEVQEKLKEMFPERNKGSKVGLTEPGAHYQSPKVQQKLKEMFPDLETSKVVGQGRASVADYFQKKASNGGAVKVRAHMRNGEPVKAHTRGR